MSEDVRGARTALLDSVDSIAKRLEALRILQGEEARAKEALDTARVAAEWELEARVYRASNRTFIRMDVEDRQVTADELKAWKAREAAKAPEVLSAEATFRQSEFKAVAARDDLEVERHRFTAHKHNLDAAVAELNARVALHLATKGQAT